MTRNPAARTRRITAIGAVVLLLLALFHVALHDAGAADLEHAGSGTGHCILFDMPVEPAAAVAPPAPIEIGLATTLPRAVEQLRTLGFFFHASRGPPLS